MARELQVREETIGLWENGLAKPLSRHYGRIVQFLGYDPEPGDRTVAGRLRAVRRRLGLSQADFAARVGLDEGSVCRWESGSRQPSRWMTERVGAILDRLGRIASGTGETTEVVQPPRPLTYFDQTRWRRRLPPDVTGSPPDSLGDRLRHRRLELGLSQGEAGKRIGVGRATVYRWERSECVPPAGFRAALIQFLGFVPPELGA